MGFLHQSWQSWWLLEVMNGVGVGQVGAPGVGGLDAFIVVFDGQARGGCGSQQGCGQCGDGQEDPPWPGRADGRGVEWFGGWERRVVQPAIRIEGQENGRVAFHVKRPDGIIAWLRLVAEAGWC